MVHCVFRRLDGVYQWGARWSSQSHDTGTHVEIVLVNYPDRQTERWDGDLGVRPATAQEIADETGVQNEATAGTALNTPLNKALRDIYWDMEQRLRALGSDSSFPAVVSETTKGGYTTALKDILKGYL